MVGHRAPEREREREREKARGRRGREVNNTSATRQAQPGVFLFLCPFLLHGVVKAAQQELMLEELNSEGMRAIDLNHKLSLKLLDKVWCGSVREFYRVELEYFWKIRVLIVPVTMSVWLDRGCMC